MATAEDYRWVVDYSVPFVAGGACVTVVKGLDVAATVLAFGGDPASVPESLDAFIDAGFYAEAVAVAVVGDAVIAVEPNGFQGSRPEVLRLLASPGSAASVYWNEAIARSTFNYAAAGEVITKFDPYTPEQRWGTEPDRLLADMAGLPFGPGPDEVPAAIALAEHVMGQGFTPSDLGAMTGLWRIVPVLEDLRPVVSVEWHGLSYHHADLVRLVSAAGTDERREVAALAARRAAVVSGLDSEPLMRQALARLTSAPGAPLEEALCQRVRMLLHRSSQAFSVVSIGTDRSAAALDAARALSLPANAANALYQATNPDSLAAALDTIASAVHVTGEGLLDEVRARLTGG